MTKRIIIIFIVAALAYYAGSKGITTGDITDWFEVSNIKEILKNILGKTIEIAQEKEVSKEAEKIIMDIKENISD